jgi:CubicO group peptidase (beta-lactamase class C family)
MHHTKLVRFCMVVLIVGALAGMTVSAQDTHPVEQRFTEWLAIINGGDAEALKQFITENYTEEALAFIPAEIRTAIESDMMRSRTWTLHSFETTSETQGSALVYSELTEAWAKIDVEVRAEEPHQIESLDVMPAEAPADAPVQTFATDAEVVSYLEGYLAKLSDAGMFSGSVLLAKNGEVLFEGAYGMADRESSIPNATDTKFNLGSMNKMFTAVAIAQLAEQGKLSFDDLISEYLPNLPTEIAEKVTIHHLLTHTSGLADYFSSPEWQQYQNSMDTVEGYFPMFIDQPLQFEPGERHQYTNANFIMLGAIIEAVSGQSYFDYVREHIYEPAGMANTEAYAKDADVDNLAIGYTSSDASGMMGTGEQHPNTDLLPAKGSPAGGGYSTLQDLYSFAEALRSGKLVSMDSFELLTSGKVDTGFNPNMRYAYGFIEHNLDGTQVVGHGGGFPGVNSNLDIFTEEGYVVVVLSNVDMGANTVVNRVREMLAAA